MSRPRVRLPAPASASASALVPAWVPAAVALGGAAGAVLRWALQHLDPVSGVPWTTLGINVTGSFALAVLAGLPAVRRRAAVAGFLGPGLLGGYTTLSAYAERARELSALGHVLQAAGYITGTLLACLLAVAAGGALSRRWADGAAYP